MGKPSSDGTQANQGRHFKNPIIVITRALGKQYMGKTTQLLTLNKMTNLLIYTWQCRATIFVHDSCDEDLH